MAWPMILSNLSAPLMGIADTAMLGHLESSIYLGAVAIGANILALLLWMFASLRMGTTSFVGRALGANDQPLLMLQLGQSLLLALTFGLILVAAKWLLIPLALQLIQPDPSTAELAAAYCHIRLFAAPASLLTFVIIGLLIGLQNARLPLMITLGSNALNILLDYVFIVRWGWNSAGAAYATLAAELVACAIALWAGHYALNRYLDTKLSWPSWQDLLAWSDWATLLRLNGDLFIRTALLLLVFNFVTAQGAQFGPSILAGNAILMQLILFQSFGLDGYAHAAEALGANALGARNQRLFLAVSSACTIGAVILALGVASGFWLGKSLLIALFTNISAVTEVVNTHYHWIVLFPLVSVWSYLLDGIFIGAGKTRLMLITMVFSVVVFLGSWWLSHDALNHGLWLSFLIFNGTRGASLGMAFYNISARHKWF